MSAERGQATVELVATLPVVIATGLVIAQLLAVGYSAVLAGNAAEAAALAIARGGDPHAAVADAMPGWSRSRAEVRVDGERVRVRMRPPSPLRALARRLEIGAAASVTR